MALEAAMAIRLACLRCKQLRYRIDRTVNCTCGVFYGGLPIAKWEASDRHNLQRCFPTRESV